MRVSGEESVGVDPSVLNESQAIHSFILRVTLPLLKESGEVPEILGTATLFRTGDRVFLVTAAHILKEDENDLSSADIDLTSIAFPSGPTNASLHTLGAIEVYRAPPEENIDVAVLEVKSPEIIEMIEKGWGFLKFDQVAQREEGNRFILSGFLVEGVRWDGRNVGQAMLTLATDPLHYIPDVSHPAPTVDQFYYLQKDGELADGSSRPIPNLKGLSGASIWSYAHSTSPFWDPSKALRVVAVQSTAKRGEWFRGVDWAAVNAILASPVVGLEHPPA
jgi:hypothetical protein